MAETKSLLSSTTALCVSNVAAGGIISMGSTLLVGSDACS